MSGGKYARPGVSGNLGRLRSGELGAAGALREAFRGQRRKAVNVLYLLGGLISLGLLVYLILALMKPEWFE